MALNTDLLLIILLFSLAGIMAIGARKLNKPTYSKLLLGIIVFSLVLMILFQIYDLSIEGATPVHSAIFYLAQLAIYGLASSLWIRMNYAKASRRSQIAMHVIAHSTLITFILTNYWLSNSYPIALIIMYPLCGFSISLIRDSIEKVLDA